MRTFTSWEPLQDPEFQSLLDAFRRFNQGMGLTPDDVRESFPKPDFRRLDADAMEVAAKVAAADLDEWLCHVCGGTSRTCECEA